MAGCSMYQQFIQHALVLHGLVVAWLRALLLLAAVKLQAWDVAFCWLIRIFLLLVLLQLLGGNLNHLGLRHGHCQVALLMNEVDDVSHDCYARWEVPASVGAPQTSNVSLCLTALH